MKKLVGVALTTAFAVMMTTSVWAGNDRMLEVKITNLTSAVILTPPVVATSRKEIPFYHLTQPASDPLAMVAEGGATGDLAAWFTSEGATAVVQHNAPIMPGQTVRILIKGDKLSHVMLASMLLPTNDGFIALQSDKVWRLLWEGGGVDLMAYDSGTEVNDELCTSIPGPQCGGEGYNVAGGEGFIFPHAGIHGDGDLTLKQYNWGEPVAHVEIRAVN